MKRYYSQTTGCSYLLGLHTSMPEDAVEIPEELFLSVICNPPPGMVRTHDEKGLPCLVDAPEPTQDLEAQERVWRDNELSGVLWLRERHRDQLEIESPTTLTTEQFNELLVYLQALRDWPQSPDFPDSQNRPKAPAWIAEQIQ
ncbi:hypothetical protein J2W43_000561 [Pseudomonas brassicacearum]|uniref:Phage tail assembly chaperone-like domain-containing protein n=1 Tax=Pseudomonas brassicacearum TaxID=930166 RepID=A0AAW8M4I7_9PSED|nr:phage tail assembly chaperone [Pseudomonas brassicacearum]MDR6956598.1 hypothetical protein [Pseudomonas brassicacearum]